MLNEIINCKLSPVSKDDETKSTSKALEQKPVDDDEFFLRVLKKRRAKVQVYDSEDDDEDSDYSDKWCNDTKTSASAPRPTYKDSCEPQVSRCSYNWPTETLTSVINEGRWVDIMKDVKEEEEKFRAANNLQQPLADWSDLFTAKFAYQNSLFYTPTNSNPQTTGPH